MPIETIETAVRLLISGEIVNYRYDSNSGQVHLILQSKKSEGAGINY